LPKEELEKLLALYVPLNENEETMWHDVTAFLKSCKFPFGKLCATGHITASAWIVDHREQSVLLTHHAKLNKWFQLGGHTEIGETIYEAAMREATEESGIKHLQYVNRNIFDIDVHVIPEILGTPEHIHYDIRFLFIADSHEPLIVSSESHDVKWIPIKEINNYTESESILRMVRKILAIDIKTSN